MDVELAILGFRPLKSDPCVYIHKNDTGFVILTLYMDDILFLSASKALFNKLKEKLMGQFKMTDVGNVSRILGIIITRDREKGAITISQNNHMEDVV